MSPANLPSCLMCGRKRRDSYDPIQVLINAVVGALPPMVSEVDVMEGGVKLKITTSERYTKLTVDGVEFFFNRESGKYDGYGQEVHQHDTNNEHLASRS